jgi:hypothetical protein
MTAKVTRCCRWMRSSRRCCRRAGSSLADARVGEGLGAVHVLKARLELHCPVVAGQLGL